MKRNLMEAQGPSRIVTRSHMMAIGQRVPRSCLLLSQTIGFMLKGNRCIKDSFGIIDEIRQNTGIVPEGVGNSFGDSEMFKILFKYVLLFN